MGSSQQGGASVKEEFAKPEVEVAIEEHCLVLGIDPKKLSASSEEVVADTEADDGGDAAADDSDEKKEEAAADESEVTPVSLTSLQKYLESLSDADIFGLLQRLGFQPPDFALKTEECLAAEKSALICLLVDASHSDFWRLNAAKHPNYKRVKNWLWVHGRYRTQMRQLVCRAQTAVGEDSAVNGAVLRKAKSDFASFVKKLDAHSDFEENMLFKFIREKLHVGDGGYPPHLELVTQQHVDELPALIGAVNDGFDKFNAAAAKGSEDARGIAESLLKDLSAFEALLLRHLQDEERALVLCWLNWTEAQYSDYRSYLTWKYKPMY